MLENIQKHQELSSIARRKQQKEVKKAVHKADIEKYVAENWSFVKYLKASAQVKKEKPHGKLLEDRVWSLFYKMNFDFLSGEGGAKLLIDPKGEKNIKSQIDVVAIDSEVAIAVECKSSSEVKKRPQFQEELGKFSQIREPFNRIVRSNFSDGHIKKHVVMIMFLSNIWLSDNDKERAKNSNIVILDEKDLNYYEYLVNHLGPAAKYQILADILPGKEIAGLSIKIPAIKTKMGGYKCYTFSISPEYLLKVSYVAHRSKGKATDTSAYQRMLTKTRLKKIKEYISKDGIFPTNIILNFERNRLNFQRAKQEGDDDADAGTLGWLSIKAAYKSAWIIDGQHRLLAYSGHNKANKSKLTVLAFEALEPSKQAALFIDINAKQKSVKQSLLEELYSQLHWEAEDPADRISAITSRVIQELNNDYECKLFQRVQTTDGEKDHLKCITLTSLFGQIEKKGFFIAKEKNGSIVEYGPLWAGDDNDITKKRAIRVFKEWLNKIAELNLNWWNLGSADGGGLAMNDGIGTLIAVLRSVFEQLETQGNKLVRLDDNSVVKLVLPYAESLGKYLASLDENQRKAFRDLRGIAGVTYRTRQCQQGIRAYIPQFNPEGLDNWLNEQNQQTNLNSKQLIEEIEVSLQEYVVEVLKDQFGIENDIWWYEGVTKQIRSNILKRMENDKNSRGGKESYFELSDFKKIILENWEFFDSALGFGKGKKEKRVEWLEFLTEKKKIINQTTSGKTISIEEYTQIVEYSNWLKEQLVTSEFDTSSID